MTQEWRTDDISLAAFLRCDDHEVVRVELEYVDNTSFGYFVFVDCTQLRESISDFISGEALVEPRMFSRTFGQLKSSIYAAEGGRRRSSREVSRKAG